MRPEVQGAERKKPRYVKRVIEHVRKTISSDMIQLLLQDFGFVIFDRSRFSLVAIRRFDSGTRILSDLLT